MYNSEELAIIVVGAAPDSPSPTSEVANKTQFFIEPTREVCPRALYFEMLEKLVPKVIEAGGVGGAQCFF